MNKETLRQYRSLRKEIENINRKILSCKTQATVKASSLEFPFTPHVVTVSGYSGINGNTLHRLKTQKQKCISECRKIEEFIYSIDDSLLRQIFQLYYLEGERRVSFKQIANKIDGYEESTLRKKHDKYLVERKVS